MSSPLSLDEPRDLAALGPEAEAARHKAAAARAVAWLVIANKPFYPFYIWWLTGEGLLLAFITALSAPLYFGAIRLARRDTRWVRAGVPVLGMADTVIATKLFGGASGVELFAVPCAMLIAMAFVSSEARHVRILAGLLFGSVVILHAFNAAVLPLWDAGKISALVSMHVISVAALSLFIVLRFTRSA